MKPVKMKFAKKYIVGILFLILILALIALIINTSVPASSKNSVFVMNGYAKILWKNIISDNYSFSNYCESNNIPDNQTVYISGKATESYDLIVEANQYCKQSRNISKDPANDSEIMFHWTIKMDKNEVSEIWTYNKPLKQEQLKQYNFRQQVDMIPKFKRDKINYAIGYYDVSTKSD